MSNNLQLPQSLMNGRYEIREYLGSGTMAVVYLGWDTRLHKNVALKFLNQQVMEDTDNPDNPYSTFKREIEALITLESCENIIKILDYDLEHDPQFIIMDYMAGGTAEDKKAEFMELSPPDRLLRVSQVLEEVILALECSHQKSIVHRDIKPSNIFFDDKTRAYLGDFGIAKNLLYDSGFSQSGKILGPVKYMAPEAIRGDVTEQSDQYSLACVIYELLTGQEVFTAETLSKLNHKILNESHTRVNATQGGSDFADSIADVLDKALSKQPENRYPSVRKFGDAFKTAVRVSQFNESPSSILNGRYTILDPIGTGGMGVVHLARDEKVNQKVAIKFLTIPKNSENSAEMVQRFHDEIAALIKLNPYKNIVDILDYGNEGELLFVIMEYMEGGDLYEKLPDYLKMDISERLIKAAQLVREISQALQKSHENGIIHRDIKLRNILFNHKGEAHLADFGIAKNIGNDAQLTQAGTIVGTINYMAPEAFNGSVIAQSDQYSLACAVYEILTGQRAFDGTTVVRLINVISKEMPPRINKTVFGRDYSNVLADVLEKALNKNPEDRYPGILEFADAFEVAVRTEIGSPLPKPVSTPHAIEQPVDSETIVPDTGKKAKTGTSEHGGTKIASTGPQEPTRSNRRLTGGIILIVLLLLLVAFFYSGGLRLLGLASTATATATVTPTASPTNRATIVPSLSLTATSTVTDTVTTNPTQTETATNTTTATATDTVMATETASNTPTATDTVTASPTPIKDCDAFVQLETSLDASNFSLDCSIFHQVETEISTIESLSGSFQVPIMTELHDECVGTEQLKMLNPNTAARYAGNLKELGSDLGCN